MTLFLFENAAILDGQSRELRLDQHVLVEDNRIVEVSDKPIRSKTSQNIDVKGMTLMPGLIDAHVHVKATIVNVGRLSDIPVSYLTADAGKFMKQIANAGIYNSS